MKKQSMLKLNTLMREAFLSAKAIPGETTTKVLTALQKGTGVIYRKKMWNVNSRRSRGRR